jgi:cyclopropane fatty-acyl-phospholipid synthase-like methyltransferase
MFDPVWNDIHTEIGRQKEALYGTKFYFKSSQFFNSCMAEHYWGRAGLTFLDLGCGTGSQSVWLASNGFKVIAVDGSETALNILHSRLTPEIARNITVLHGDIEELDLEEQSIDCVVDICALQYLSLEKAITLVSKARTWLKPDGWLFSEMATEPYSHAWDRGSTTRTVTQQEIFAMFVMFKIKMEKQELHTDHGLISHLQIEATPTAKKYRLVTS